MKSSLHFLAFRSITPVHLLFVRAWVVELVDTRDLKSLGL